MPTVYLTPASISYLTQFILSGAITIYLFVVFQRRKAWARQSQLLAAFFASITLFIGLLFSDSITLGSQRMYAIYAENSILGIALLFLLQFAYHFPTPQFRHKLESQLALVLSIVYILCEIGIAIFRFSELNTNHQVLFRPPWPDYMLGSILLWIPIAFLRQCIAADTRPLSWLVKLWNPSGNSARGAREFAFIFFLLFIVANISFLRIWFLVSDVFFNAVISIGILTTLWLFASRYINFIPGGATVLVKVSVIALTLLLAALGTLGLVVTPAHAREYRPFLAGSETLRFTPAFNGGYEVSRPGFSFETRLGDVLSVNPWVDPRDQKLDFTFPFFGKTYTELWVASSGAIGFGQGFNHNNIQSCCFRVPSIFPLMVDLDTNYGGKIYAFQDDHRLVITWYRLSSMYYRDEIYTFQVVLYKNGVFDITYESLPEQITFDPDSLITGNPVLRGITPGIGNAIYQETHFDLSDITYIGPQGAVQNIYVDFRSYIHQFILPLAWLILGTSLVFLVALPWLVYSSITKPLSGLLEGVQQMDAGNLDVAIPIQSEDDISFLTGAFNRMASTLRETVRGLDQKVADRTADLAIANQQLEEELIARKEIQDQILAQQRRMAALDERERLSRQLHDGLGQVMGYINVQTQAAQTLLKQEQLEAAFHSLDRVAQLSQEAHQEIRNFILGLRADCSLKNGGLLETLQKYIQNFGDETNLQVKISLPPDNQLPSFPPAIEEQVLHIIQEALTNIRKHAFATKAEILFSFENSLAQIIITDDGIGFNPQQAAENPGNHFGLKMMQERAELVGGRLEIRSGPREGTRLIAFIPIPEKQKTGTFPVTKDGLAHLRILLADDSPLFREGLRNMLMARGLTVVGMAGDGIEAQELTRQLRPDVVVMDVSMPKRDGLEATRLIKAEFPETKIIMLTVSESDDVLFEAMRSGAAGYLLKGMEANDFFALLARLTEGETPQIASVASRLVAPFSNRTATLQGRASDGLLSERQWQILDLVARGLTYKETAISLHLSEQTVKYHMGQILERLHLENRAQAIAYARRLQQ